MDVFQQAISYLVLNSKDKALSKRQIMSLLFLADKIALRDVGTTALFDEEYIFDRGGIAGKKAKQSLANVRESVLSDDSTYIKEDFSLLNEFAQCYLGISLRKYGNLDDRHIEELIQNSPEYEKAEEGEYIDVEKLFDASPFDEIPQHRLDDLRQFYLNA